MSYEGFEQIICKSGHYFARDCYDDRKCPTCGEDDGWTNSVDDTNCEFAGQIPYHLLCEKFLISEATSETCPTCKHTNKITHNIFRVPTQDETRPLRHWRPGGITVLIPYGSDSQAVSIATGYHWYLFGRMWCGIGIHMNGGDTAFRDWVKSSQDLINELLNEAED